MQRVDLFLYKGFLLVFTKKVLIGGGALNFLITIFIHLLAAHRASGSRKSRGCGTCCGQSTVSAESTVGSRPRGDSDYDYFLKGRNRGNGDLIVGTPYVAPRY